MRKIKIDENCSQWFEGVISLEQGDGWVKPWRLPCQQAGLFSPDHLLADRAQMSSGSRMRFATDSGRLELQVMAGTSKRRLDLTIDGELVQSVLLEAGQETAVFDAISQRPAGRKIVELWLPQDFAIRICELRIEDGATAEPVEDKRPRWITYGSSITHCRNAHSPARTWPATAARIANLDLTCLGFGGQCHLDAMVARMIRDMPADFISLKVGINVQGGSTLSSRTFRPGVIAFVQIVREKHPNTPIALISPIISPPREARSNAVGLSLMLIREHVKDAADRLAAAGDRNLHYFDGLDLFGADLVDSYLPDLLHPNGDGYEILGRNFERLVLSTLGVVG